MISTGYEFSSFGGENLPKLNMVMAVQFCEYTTNHRIVQFKWVNYVTFGLFFNKVMKKTVANKIYWFFKKFC